MLEALYEKLNYPEACQIDKVIFKKLFLENEALKSAGKRTIQNDLGKAVWKYILRADTTGVMAYKDEKQEYSEIAFLEIRLNKDKAVKKLSELLNRLIPYPLILLFVCEDRIAFSLARKRSSLAEKGAMVAEEFYYTKFIPFGVGEDNQAAFIEALSWKNLDHTNLQALYETFINAVIAYNSSQKTDSFSLENTKDKKEALIEITQLEASIEENRRKLKKEDQFNTRLELNMKIKQAEAKIQELINAL